MRTAGDALHSDRDELQRRSRLLLRDLGGDGCRGALPRAEAEGFEYPCDPAAEIVQNRLLDLLVGEQVQRPVEVHDEPKEHARGEYHETGLEDVALETVPRVVPNARHRRHVVRGELEDERRRLAREEPRLLERDAAEDDDRDSDDVHHRGDVPLLAEEERREHRDDDRLRSARDERRKDDGHAPRPLVLDGPRRHHGRHAAALADEHRDERLAGEPEAAKEAIHYERDTRHVAAVLEEREEEEHDEDDRDEAENSGDASPSAVHDKALHRVVHAGPVEGIRYERAETGDPYAELPGIWLLELLRRIVCGLVYIPLLGNLARFLVFDGRLLLAGLPRGHRGLGLRELALRVLELHALVLSFLTALVRRERKVPSVREEAVVRPVG